MFDQLLAVLPFTAPILTAVGGIYIGAKRANGKPKPKPNGFVKRKVCDAKHEELMSVMMGIKEDMGYVKGRIDAKN